MAILVFVGIALLSAVTWHRYLQTYSSASIAAAATTVVVFQLIVYLQLGYLDPFFPIAVVTTGALSLVISFIVGLPIRARRLAAKAKHES